MNFLYFFIVFIHVLFSPSISKEEADPFEKKTSLILKAEHIHDLPLPILSEIFVHVIDEPKDIAPITATCKKWYKFMSKDKKYFAQKFLNKQYQKVLQHFKCGSRYYPSFLCILYVWDIHNEKLREIIDHDNVLSKSTFKPKEVLSLCRHVNDIWARGVGHELMKNIEGLFKIELIECFKSSYTNKNFQEAFALLLKLQKALIFKTTDGGIYFGSKYQYNLLQRRGIFIDQDSKLLIGDFIDGRLNGKGISYTPTNVECGNFKNGTLNGYGKQFRPNAWTYDHNGFFKNGAKQPNKTAFFVAICRTPVILGCMLLPVSQDVKTMLIMAYWLYASWDQCLTI